MSVKNQGTPAASQTRPEEKAHFPERLNDFMRANRIAILTFIVLIVIAVAALGIAAFITQDRLAKSTIALETLESNYDAWTAISEDQRPGQSAAILSEADALISRYSREYAAQRARILKGLVLYELKDYAGAEDAYLGVSLAVPESHLAPVALANAAAMAEERGDTEAALAHLIEAENSYPGAPGAGRVSFSIGRIYEETRQFDKAMAAYGRLVALGNESDWTKLAHDRIIYLRSLGLAK
ncbi:MAG: tetratricopeptide repeat protein [Spirochaetales bacterium]|nr:MAG: tetratricopeptide repeat protein [Spirochaetales bacterium]